MSQQDRPLLGIAFIVAFCALVPLGDSAAKALGPIVPVSLFLLARFGIQAIFMAGIAILAGRSFATSRYMLLMIVLRSAFQVGAMTALFIALRYLPLADSIAILFVMPLITIVLGALILHEPIGPWRIAASIVGFAGTLLVVQPNFSEVGWPAFMPMLAAGCFAGFMLVTRVIAKQTDSLSLQATSGAVSVLLLLPWLIFKTGEMQTALGNLEPVHVALLVFAGCAGSVLHLLMTFSLRFASSTTIAPMQYLEIPFAALFGWLFFGGIPNGLAIIGIVITVSAGLFALYRERIAARRKAIDLAPVNA